jgi:hypothetical protein
MSYNDSSNSGPKMNKRILSLFLGILVVAVAAIAQEGGTINYTPVSCIRGGEMPVLQVSLDRKGIIRGYFRRVNTTDWCSVEGKNEGPLSTVTLPKFDTNDEIEYYFLLIEGKQVVAKSPQIYRVRVTSNCETPFARHVLMITMDCSNKGPGSMPASTGAGLAIKSNLTPPQPATPSSRNGNGQ